MNITTALEDIKQIIWGPWLLAFIGICGIYLTVLFKGFQFRYLFPSLKSALFPKKFPEKNAKNLAPSQHLLGEMSHFQALMTSLAGAIGTGNIAGVATAITMGGMGALFWMWVIALLGMMIKYCESFLAIRFRVQNSRSEMSGGPMYYLSLGAGSKFLGGWFAACGILATIGTGNMVQVHSVADAFHHLFGLEPVFSGIFIAILTGVVLLGGVKAIGRVAEVFVPIMALFYLIGGLIILAIFADRLPDVLMGIMTQAFQGQAAFGGFSGASVAMAIQSGVARGIFSNEAGLGTSSIAAAAAKSDHPGHQAMISMTGAFLSTIVVCTITGLVIGVTGVFGDIDPVTGRLMDGAPLAMKAFSLGLWKGDLIVTIGLIFFAYSTILAWAYYGEKCVEYLFGIKSIFIYRGVYIACILLGAVLELSVVWTFADIMNGLMVLPNLIGILICRRLVQKETKEFLENK